MNYKIDHKQLRAILSGTDRYSELVSELTQQVLGLKRPFTTVSPSGDNGDKLNEFGFEFLKEAKVLVPEEETA